MAEKKKSIVKSKTEKPSKKVKSFNLDDKVYSNLMELLDSSGAQITLSALVDDFLRKLYVYLIEVEGITEKQKSDLPLASVIYDCPNIEYFQGLHKQGKEGGRLQNLIWSYEASKLGISLSAYLADMAGEME